VHIFEQIIYFLFHFAAAPCLEIAFQLLVLWPLSHIDFVQYQTVLVNRTCIFFHFSRDLMEGLND
jgi:hypothetical protein